MKHTIKKLLYQYRHAWVFSYGIVYMIWFFWLESRTDIVHHPVHIGLDDLIPFQEIFIVPYLLWFVYIAATLLYFFFTSTEDFYKATAFLFIGMTVCLIIYTVWPNGQNLRPSSFPRDNVFSRLVGMIYSADTSTNVCPSIHVFNSIGIHIAIRNSQALRPKKWLQIGSFLLMVSICLSTVFLKQHSVFDGLCAVLLSVIMYAGVYIPNYRKVMETRTAKKQLERTM